MPDKTAEAATAGADSQSAKGDTPAADPLSDRPATPELEDLQQGDHTDCSLRMLLALRQAPAIGWFNATGFTARQLRPLSGSPAIRRLRFSLSEEQLASPRRLHTVFRQKLMAQLDNCTDLASLNTIGRLLEKVQPENAAGADPERASLAEDSLRLLQRLELLLERLEGSRELLDASASATKPEAAPAQQEGPPWLA